MFVDAHRPWREVKVTDQRTAADFARCMRDLVDIHYADATLIRNLRRATDPLFRWAGIDLDQPPDEGRTV